MPDREDLAFDLWLRRTLASSYSAVLREPVPDALVRLLAPEAPGR